MRYPTMTRVLAVFLALASLMLIAAGGFGIYKSSERHREKLQELDTIKDRAEQYMELNLQLAGKTSYKEEKEALDEKNEKFDEESSDHRRELTEYTAKKGGMQMVTEALDQAQAMFDGMKAEFQAGLKEFEAKEAEFNAGYSQYLAGCEALKQGKAAYESSMQGLNATKQTLEALESLQALNDSTDPMERQSLGLKACDDAIVALDNTAAAISNLIAAGIITQEQADAIEAEVVKAAGMGSTDLRAKVQASRDSIAAKDPSEAISDEEFQQFQADYAANLQFIKTYSMISKMGIAKAEPQLQQTKAQLDASEAQLNQMAPMMEEGKKGIEQGRAMMEQGKAAIDAAEAQLYGSRTLIWYELGQLDEKFSELEMEKAKLEGDSEELKKLEQQAEERKKLENRRTSLSVQLREEKRIKELYEADTELYDAAQIYLGEFESEIRSEHMAESIAEALMIITGILGFTPLFSSFGKEKGRKKRLIFPCAVLIFAGITLTFGFAENLGLFKSSLVVLAAAAAVILSAIPNKKKKEILIEE